jgi:hypothetical protein
MRGLILFIIAVFLLYLLAPIGLFYAMFKPSRGRYLYRVAFSIDQTGNAICGKLFNDLFIHEDGFKFGHPDHSISAVLGVNEYNGSLTSFGWLICAILDKIDADHCIKSAKEEGLIQ